MRPQHWHNYRDIKVWRRYIPEHQEHATVYRTPPLSLDASRSSKPQPMLYIARYTDVDGCAKSWIIEGVSCLRGTRYADKNERHGRAPSGSDSAYDVNNREPRA